MKVDTLELERRVHIYIDQRPRGPGRFRKDHRIQFINAAVELGFVGRIDGLHKLGKLAGIVSHQARVKSVQKAVHRLLRWLEEARIAEVTRESAYIPDIDRCLTDHKYVISLHSDLILEAE